jgi:hypothetical protein
VRRRSRRVLAGGVLCLQGNSVRRLKRISRRSAEELPLDQRKCEELTSRYRNLRDRSLVELTEEKF